MQGRIAPDFAHFPGISATFVFGQVCSARNSILDRTPYIHGTGYSRTGFISVLTHLLRAVEFDASGLKELEMKKLVVALTALAALTGSASAADLAPVPTPRPRLPVPRSPAGPAATSARGGGGAYTNNDHNDFDHRRARRHAGPNLTTGARGWFGTVGAGCDYQFDRLRGRRLRRLRLHGCQGRHFDRRHTAPVFVGSQKLDWQWAIGGRVGYLIFSAVADLFLGRLHAGPLEGDQSDRLRRRDPVALFCLAATTQWLVHRCAATNTP